MRHQLELASRGRADEPAPPRGRNTTLVDTPAHLGSATPFVRQEQVTATASVPFPPPAPRDDYQGNDVRTQVGGARPAAPALPFACKRAGARTTTGRCPSRPPRRPAAPSATRFPTQPNSGRAASPALPFSAPAYSDEAPTQAKSGYSRPRCPSPARRPCRAGCRSRRRQRAAAAAPAPKAVRWPLHDRLRGGHDPGRRARAALPHHRRGERAARACASRGLPFRVPRAAGARAR